MASKTPLADIVWVLCDNLLRAIQDCHAMVEAWDKLQSQYFGKSMINRLIELNNLLNKKLKSSV